VPQAIAALAGRQHGVVAFGQLLGLGLSPDQVHRWKTSARLQPIHRGVYAVGHRSITQEARWLAAVLACGEGACLSHGPAGQLQGFVDRRERLALHVSLTGNTDRSIRGVVTHRPRNLDAGDTLTRRGIPVTDPTRTVWDLASIWTPTAVGRALARAERCGLSRRRMAELLSASPNRRGAGVIRKLLAETPLPLAETRSWLEELLVFTCREHSLPLPAINVPLRGYEVDFLWPVARFVVEADGSDHLVPAQRDRDNERDVALARAGYLVRRYSYPAMLRRRDVAAEVLAILRERIP